MIEKFHLISLFFNPVSYCCWVILIHFMYNPMYQIYKHFLFRQFFEWFCSITVPSIQDLFQSPFRLTAFYFFIWFLSHNLVFKLFILLFTYHKYSYMLVNQFQLSFSFFRSVRGVFFFSQQIAIVFHRKSCSGRVQVKLNLNKHERNWERYAWVLFHRQLVRICLKAEPYQSYSIPPNWGPTLSQGPKIQSRHHFAPQRELRHPKLKYDLPFFHREKDLKWFFIMKPRQPGWLKKADLGDHCVVKGIYGIFRTIRRT